MPDCLIVDAGEHCTLRESLTGFKRGLAAASIRFESVAVEAVQPAGLIVVPGATLNSPGLAQAMHRLCSLGNTVLYESGAAYSEREAFAIEQQQLRNTFGLLVEAPAELWRARPGSNRPSYVHYRWPLRVMVRDFSRIIPVSGEASEVARLDDLRVACRSQVRRGTFVFLGSPLGPHLGCGDPDAQSLLKAFWPASRSLDNTDSP